MGTVISPEAFNVLYFPCDISSVAFSFDSNYLAVAGEEGLVVFQANAQLSMFEPIGCDVQKGVNILSLQWTASNSIEYLCLGMKDRSLQIHRVNISPGESELVERPAETSYTIDSLWKYRRTPWQRGNKTCRYEFGANGGFFAGVSNRSVEIFKSSSKSKPKHGFMSDFTPKVEIISNIVRQLNNIEMQQSSNQDEDSNTRGKSYKEKNSQSVKKDRYLSPDAAQKQPVLKRERDEDKESLPIGKKQKQDHTFLVSKRGRDEEKDEETLPTEKKEKQDHTLLASKRSRDEDEDEDTLPTGKKQKQDQTLVASKRGRNVDKDEDEETLPVGKKQKQDRTLLASKRGRDEEEESLPTGKKQKQDRTLLASKRGRDDYEEDTVDGEESLASSKKAKFHEDKESQDVEKTPVLKEV